MALFNPNMIGTQTTAVAPKIVSWSAYEIDNTSVANDLAGTTISGQPHAASATSVEEGKYAWAAFKFVHPTTGTGTTAAIEQMDAVKMGFAMSGASASDYINNGQLYVFSLNSDGTIKGLLKAPANTSINTTAVTPVVAIGGGSAITTTTTTAVTSYSDVNTSNNTLADSSTDPINLGTGVYGLLLVSAVKIDGLVESGDRVLFQVTTSDHTKFTDSAYVEQYVDIADKHTASSKIVVAGAAGSTVDASMTNIHAVTQAALGLPAGPTADISTINLGGGSTANVDGTTVLPTAANLTSVKEGQLAVAKFSFVEAAPSGVASLVAFDRTGAATTTTELRVSYTGASATDYVANSFKVVAYNNTAGAATLLTVTNGKVTVPAGTHEIFMSVQTAQDTLVEQGDEVNFQIGKVDVDSFFQSDYVEKKIQIVDYVRAYDTQFQSITGTTVPNASGYTQDPITASATADKFVLTHTNSGTVIPRTVVSNGTSGAGNWEFDSIASFGAGDVMEVDIAGTTAPNFNLVNFGNLNMTEAALIDGLRALNGVEALPGGVYVMGATDTNGLNTYIIIDSNNDGKLTTNSLTNADVFIKLAGVAPSAMESNDFALV